MVMVMYERLERYDEITGAHKGSHVKLFDTETRRETDAISYAKAAEMGFAQSDILTQIEVGAIAAADAAVEELRVTNETLAQAQMEISQLQQERTILLREIAGLRAAMV